MQQSGEHQINAPPAMVWRALNDPEVLSRCIEGCQSMTRIADDAFEAVINAKIGPVNAPFTASVKLEDMVAPRSYTLRVNVKGAAGLAKGVARVALSAQGGATLLRYEVDGNVAGKLAQIGQRLIDAAARKMADDFFAAFGQAVAAGVAPPIGESDVKADAGRRMIWIGAGALVSLAILLAILFVK